MKKKTFVYSIKLPISLLTGSLCCSLAAAQHPFPVVRTNVVVVIGGHGSGTNNGTPNLVTGYSGQAAGAFGLLGGFPLRLVSVAETNLMSTSGGVEEASALQVEASGGALADTAHAAIIGQDGTTAAEASVANLKLTVGPGFMNSETATITADFVMSKAGSACSTNGVSYEGRSLISGLAINGEPVHVTGELNQAVALPGWGYLIINEQTPGEVSFFENEGTELVTTGMVVNALHVIGPEGQMFIGSATAGISCPDVSPQICGDFATGAGWIRSASSAGKASFGVAGGVDGNVLWGHLTYVDAGAGLSVRSTSVTGYQPDATDADGRQIDYEVTINGAPGRAEVKVYDHSPSGTNDVFQIELSNGYVAGGYLGAGQPEGGDIEVHTCASARRRVEH